MKRFMQFMLAVTLVFVTAFAFHIDTASAQPVSAPVPANTCSPNTICNPGSTCILPPRQGTASPQRCTFPNTGRISELTLTNMGTAGVEAIVSYAGGEFPANIATPPNNVFSRTLVTSGSDVVVFNTSRTCTIHASIISLFSDTASAQVASPSSITTNKIIKYGVLAGSLSPGDKVELPNNLMSSITGTFTNGTISVAGKVTVAQVGGTGNCGGKEIVLPVGNPASIPFSCNTNGGQVTFTNMGPATALFNIQF